MTKRQTLSINIPFQGFYESWYSSEVDSIEERESEHFEEYRQAEEGVADELRLAAGQCAEILFRHTDYGAAYDAIAREYVQCFEDIASEDIAKAQNLEDFKLGLEFEEMTSPREYNFETDRLFCRIPVSVVRKLFAMSKRDDHATLAAVIRERFTSREGFLSYYRNDLAAWLAKPLLDWDHNELGTLLRAMHRLAVGNEERGEHGTGESSIA